MTLSPSWKVWCVTDIIRRVKAGLDLQLPAESGPPTVDTEENLLGHFVFCSWLLCSVAPISLLWRPLVVPSFETCALHKRRATAPSAGRRMIHFKGRVESCILGIVQVNQTKSASLHHWVHWWVPVVPVVPVFPEFPARLWEATATLYSHESLLSHTQSDTHFAVWVISQRRWAAESAPSASTHSLSAACEVCARRDFPVLSPRAKVALGWHVKCGCVCELMRLCVC